MEILIILFLLLISIYLAVLIFKGIKLFYKNRASINWAFVLLLILISGIIISITSIKKMEIIPSKAYDNLFLIKDPVDNQDTINAMIKKTILQKVTNDAKLKKLHHNYKINFYKYYKGWGLNPIAGEGTAYFIENPEDQGGFSVEVLSDYSQYQMASFTLHFCNQDSLKFYGILNQTIDSYISKTDTLINFCGTQKNLP